MAWWNRNALGVRQSVEMIERASTTGLDGYNQPPEWNSQPHYGPTLNSNDPSGWLLSGGNDAGVNVTEQSALGSTAFFRSVSVIASTLATLPMKSYSTDGDDVRTLVKSIFDNPGAPYFTSYEWKELVFVHLVLHGNAYLLHMYNEGGALVGLFPLHPDLVTPEWVSDAEGRITGKRFKMTIKGETIYKSESEMTQIMGLGTDGLAGLSVLTVARNAIGTTLAGDRAAAKMFSSGMLIGGLVTTDDTVDEDDGKIIMAGLKQKLTGTNNAGDIAMVNASLKFTPWSMSAEDAQFLESRQYQVEEISRLLGVPKVLLAEDGASSWGTGINQLLSYMQKTTFVPWTTRVEERLSLLLSSPRHVEFEYKGLLQGTPAEEVALLVQMIAAGIIDTDEARAILNLEPRVTPAPAPEVAPPATGTASLPATNTES